MTLKELLQKHNAKNFELIMILKDEEESPAVFYYDDEYSFDFTGYDGFKDHDKRESYEDVFEMWGNLKLIEERDCYYINENNIVICAVRIENDIEIVEKELAETFYYMACDAWKPATIFHELPYKET